MDKYQKELFRKEVGKIVERFRLEKGYSRLELGEALGYQGNSAIQVIARIESGRAGIPKAKIDKLVSTLGIKNSDFGLGSTKSIKNFISAGGFLGTPGKLLGASIVDMMDANEAEAMKEVLVDESAPDVEPSPQQEQFMDVARLMKIYRAQKETPTYSLIELINIVDNLTTGDDQTFIEILTLLKIDPESAYQAVEQAITELLSTKRE